MEIDPGDLLLFARIVETGSFSQAAERTGLPVCAGPVEATALGNALVQGIALGMYNDLADARRHLGAPP